MQHCRGILSRRWLGALVLSVLLLFPIYGVEGSEATIRDVIPLKDGCVLIYGSSSFGGSNFFVEKCGNNWRLLDGTRDRYFKQIRFVGTNVAWATVSHYLVRLRFLNGVVYREEAISLEDDTPIESVYFIDERIGWLTGFDGLMAKTVDGGRTWNRVGLGTKSVIYDIRFLDKDFGWAMVKPARNESIRGSHLETRDGGITWSWVPVADGVQLRDLFFTSADHGCGVAARDAIYCTFGRQIWERVELEPANRLGIYFVDSHLGWHVGSSIMRTKDGGRTWTYQVQADKDRKDGRSMLILDDVIFADRNLGWAWGLKMLFETVDGGESWKDISHVLFDLLKDPVSIY